MHDIFQKCSQFFERRQALAAQDLAIMSEVFTKTSPACNAGPWMEIDGRRVLQLGSNDYLGLALHEESRRRAARVVDAVGIGAPMGSRLLTGTTHEHLDLENELAAFKRREAGLSFATGAMAMIGALAALAGKHDQIILDENAHATLIAGAKVSGARILFFRHNDTDHLRSVLARVAAAAPTLIVVDGVYSMQGDLAPLPEIVALAKQHGARLFVDDAHGTGVMGPQGRGTAAHFGVADAIDLEAGTFSKALGTIGGFVVGDRAVIDYLRYNAPTLLFSKALPLAVVEATRASLALLAASDGRRQRLLANKERLQTRLRSHGFSVGATQTPITPIEFEDQQALFFAHELMTSCQIWAPPVVYPAVPMGRSILRVIPTASHSESDLDYFVESLAQIRASFAIGALAAW